MNIPKHHGNVPAEGVSELQSLDYLEIVEALKPRAATAGGQPDASSLSIAPVGLDLMPHLAPVRVRAGAAWEAVPTVEGPLRRSHRRAGLVLGALAGVALIVVGAGVARVGLASSTPSVAEAPETQLATATSTPRTTNVTPSAAAPPPGIEGGHVPAPTDGSSAGTVRIASGLSPKRVLFDGKKVASASSQVSCGTHQIKVGRGRAHSVDVPCGGEIVVSK